LVCKLESKLSMMVCCEELKSLWRSSNMSLSWAVCGAFPSTWDRDDNDGKIGVDTWQVREVDLACKEDPTFKAGHGVLQTW
jgi:hypothetical protein